MVVPLMTSGMSLLDDGLCDLMVLMADTIGSIPLYGSLRLKISHKITPKE